MERRKMRSKKEKPFAITCRYCGCNACTVIAFGYRELEIRCKGCGKTLTDVGIYESASEWFWEED